MGKRSAANGKVGKRSAGLFRHAKPAAALVVLAFAGFGAVQVALSQVASLPSEVPLVTTTSAGDTPTTTAADPTDSAPTGDSITSESAPGYEPTTLPDNAEPTDTVPTTPTPTVEEQTVDEQPTSPPDGEGAAQSSTAPTVSASDSTVTAGTGSASADGQSSATVTVHVVDTAGNPAAGILVSLHQGSGTHAVISGGGQGTTDSGGDAAFTVTDVTPETVTFTATDDSDSLTLAGQASVTFTLVGVVASATQSTIQAAPRQVPADGESSSTVTVTVLDAFGHPLGGKDVTLHQDKHSAITPAHAVTDAVTGQAVFTVTDGVAEEVHYTATVDSDELQLVSTAVVHFGAAANENLPLTIAAVPDAPIVSPGARTGYTVTINNPNSSLVVLASLTIHLPTGFQYVPGSTSGAVSTDPDLAGQEMTWTGIPVPGSGSGLGVRRVASVKAGASAVHFDVVSTSTPGLYTLSASGKGGTFTVAPASQTGQITVQAPSGNSGGGGSTSTPTTSTATVASVPTQQEAPTPTDPQTFGVGAALGTVLVDGKPLVQGQIIPRGTTLDTTNGVVQIKALTPAGEVQSAIFFGAVFTIDQATDQTPLLQLKGGDFPTLCGGAKRAVSAVGAKPPKAKPKAKPTAKKKIIANKTVVRSLWGQGKGNFRTQGRFASATVRGTLWLTSDRCDGTLTEVKEGIVDVFDQVRSKHFLVAAGHSYLVRPS